MLRVANAPRPSVVLAVEASVSSSKLRPKAVACESSSLLSNAVCRPVTLAIVCVWVGRSEPIAILRDPIPSDVVFFNRPVPREPSDVAPGTPVLDSRTTNEASLGATPAFNLVLFFHTPAVASRDRMSFSAGTPLIRTS